MRAERVLVQGPAADGPSLVLEAPLSFWGGVDARSGTICDVRHPQHGQCVAGTVLFLPGTIGSSSAAAVFLELIHNGAGPAALVLHEPDAILLLGALVATEMNWPAPPAVQLDRALHDRFKKRMVAISDGEITTFS